MTIQKDQKYSSPFRREMHIVDKNAKTSGRNFIADSKINVPQKMKNSLGMAHDN